MFGMLAAFFAELLEFQLGLQRPLIAMSAIQYDLARLALQRSQIVLRHTIEKN